MNLRRLTAIAAGALAMALAALPAPAQTVLRATGTGSNPPFHFLDPATGAQRGISVDIINAIAAELGMTVQWLALTPIGQMEAAIIAGAVDTYAGAIDIRVPRADLVTFSVPWYVGAGDGAWVLRTDPADYRSVLDFRGLVIGAVRGSGFAAELAGMAGVFAEVRLYDTPAALAGAVQAGEVRGGVLNGFTAAYTLAQGLYPDLKIPGDYGGTLSVGRVYGTPFHRDATDLLARFDAVLVRMMADGTVRRIFAGYGVPYADYTR